MVIDSSALIAILLKEAEALTFAEAIAADPRRLISAFSVLETSVVMETKKGEAGGRELDLLLHRAGIQTVSFDAEQAETARRAFRRFGKGRHAAGLNVGDCCSYALSQQSGQALLFKGDDFSKTDVTRIGQS